MVDLDIARQANPAQAFPEWRVLNFFDGWHTLDLAVRQPHRKVEHLAVESRHAEERGFIHGRAQHSPTVRLEVLRVISAAPQETDPQRSLRDEHELRLCSLRADKGARDS